VGYPQDQTLVSLFEQQVERTPHNVALVFEDKQLTYRQLNEKANQLAHYLRQHYQVGAGMLVGVLLERSEWMVAALLGVLKAGGAYVPIDRPTPGSASTTPSLTAPVLCCWIRLS
jgi:non-ribosomal peptide synthetase component F